MMEGDVKQKLDRRRFLGWGLTLGASLLSACASENSGAIPNPSSRSASLVTPGAVGTPAVQASPARQLNTQPLKIGYLPITDASALLVAHALGYYQEEGLAVEQPVLFRGWAQIAEAFQAGQVNVVHLLMPLAIWLRYGRQFPAKVVAWNHLNGSAFTTATSLTQPAQLGGRLIAVPFWYSIHNVTLQMLLRVNSLEPVLGSAAQPGPNQVKLLVMAPPDMLPALASGRIAGYIVADPFNALAEIQKQGRIFRFTGDIWRDHACCVVVMREEDLAQRPNWAQAVVNAVVRAQLWLREHRTDAAQILTTYLPQPLEAIARVFTTPLDSYAETGAVHHLHWHPQWIDFQPYPYPSFTRALVEALKQTAVEGDTGFLAALEPDHVAQDLVDERFVREAIEAHGGPAAFSQPPDWERQEEIDAA